MGDNQRVADLFVQLTGTESSYRLHRVPIISSSKTSWRVALDVSDDAHDAVVFFVDKSRRFAGQRARIEAGPRARPRLIVALGALTDAEKRGAFRVLTPELTISIAGGDLPLVDVSASGLCVFAQQHWRVGSSHAASLSYDGKSYAGPICVQNVRTYDDGRQCYGMLCSELKGPLAEGLGRIVVATERELLRRAKM